MCRIPDIFLLFGSLLLCINILVYLKRVSRKNKLPILKESPFLWFQLWTLHYYGVNLPFIGFYNYLAKVSQEFLTIYFNLTFVLSCIMNLLICIGFLCFQKSGRICNCNWHLDAFYFIYQPYFILLEICKQQESPD